MAEQKYGLEKFLADLERDAQGVQRGISGVGGGIADTIRRDFMNTRSFLRSEPQPTQIQPDFSPRGGSVAGRSAASAAADRQMAEVARLGGPAALRAATARGVSDAQMMQNAPSAATPQGQAGGGMGGMNPISALFAPMFADLRQQKKLANQRYEANSQQVTNIYGQITGARSADKATTEMAFKRLIDAASTRSTAVNTGIDASEAARLQQNQAALQSMGLEGLSTSQGDIASQTAAQAKQTNALNSANYENMLRVMGATAGQQVDSDVAAFNFAKLEDLGQLRGAREEFAQDLTQQRGELRSQRAQANFEYQQAQQRSAAAARAAEQRAAQRSASAEEKAAANALRNNGPAVVIVDSFVRNRQLNPEEGRMALDSITEFYQNVPAPMGKWTASGAKNALFAAAGANLNAAQKRAISAVFDETLPKG